MLETWLEAPDGTTIRPTEAGTTYPNVQFVYGDGYFFFRVQFPAFPARPDVHSGPWRLWLHSRPGRVINEVKFSHAGAAANIPFVYTAMAKARSDLLLPGYLAQSAYAPGSRMTLVLEPKLFGEPVTLEEPVVATATRPDGVIRAVALALQANGTYAGVFDDSWLVGSYRFDVEAGATTPLGNHVTRYRTLSGIIYLPRKGGDGGGGNGNGGASDDDCRRARAWLDRLDRLLAGTRDIDPGLAKEISGLLVEIRRFLAECCGCSGKTASIQDAFARAERLIKLAERNGPPS
jgi:hypothetical protein